MSIEFDPQCGTSQPEDCLKIYIPPKLNQSESDANKTEEKSVNKVKVQKSFGPNDKETGTNDQNILIKKFNTESGWSTNAIIVPGNDILLSMETASNYLMDHKLNRYGFKCILIGYENIDDTKNFNNSLLNLESELTYLGGMCSANLMRKDLIFSGNSKN
jgi:E3 ubiquitin-protein ligase MYCBP2